MVAVGASMPSRKITRGSGDCSAVVSSWTVLTVVGRLGLMLPPVVGPETPPSASVLATAAKPSSLSEQSDFPAPPPMPLVPPIPATPPIPPAPPVFPYGNSLASPHAAAAPARASVSARRRRRRSANTPQYYVTRPAR